MKPGLARNVLGPFYQAEAWWGRGLLALLGAAAFSSFAWIPWLVEQGCEQGKMAWDRPIAIRSRALDQNLSIPLTRFARVISSPPGQGETQPSTRLTQQERQYTVALAGGTGAAAGWLLFGLTVGWARHLASLFSVTVTWGVGLFLLGQLLVGILQTIVRMQR